MLEELISRVGFALALILLLGITSGKLSRRLGFPSITGYLIVGIIFGPSLTNLISPEVNFSLTPLKELGIGLIAMIIGGELRFNRLRRVSGNVIAVTLSQVVFSFISIFIAVKLMGYPAPVALLLAALGTATAVIAVASVVRELDARGEFTFTLLAIVALSDAAAIVVYNIVSLIAKVSLVGSVKISSFSLPVLELLGSIGLGVGMGFVLVYLLKFTPKKPEMIVLFLGFVFLSFKLGSWLQMSPILINLIAGMVVVNYGVDPEVFVVFEDLELPLYIVFFVLAGASLNLRLFFQHWWLVIIYFLSRFLGKISGSFIGGSLTPTTRNVRFYSGLATLPMGGVSISLLLALGGEFASFPQIVELVTAVLLGGVVINELVGPLGVKYALIASRETGEERGY
jgi:Kef-type K+ transport system membrane component KefB